MKTELEKAIAILDRALRIKEIWVECGLNPDDYSAAVAEAIDKCLNEFANSRPSSEAIKAAMDKAYLFTWGDMKNKKFIEYRDRIAGELGSGWISVDDRLPENRQQVLCYNGSRMLEKSYEMHTDQDDKWFKERYTHWQPLPSPPTK